VRLLAALALLAALTPGQVSAQSRPPAVKNLHIAGSSGQQALTVEVQERGLRVSACGAAPCGGGQQIEVPEAFQGGLGGATLDAVKVGRGRSVARVVLREAGGRSWVALVAGPLGAGPAQVIFAGEADTSGSPAAQEKRLVQVFEEGGGSSLVVGARDREVHLCGRPTVLSPQVLDPSDLKLKPARVQRLSRAERDRAVRLTASVSEGRQEPLGRLLGVVGASSAEGAPGALVDGDPETWWSEGKGGDGRGEFVVFRAPREAPIRGLRLTIRPPGREVPGGVAPSRLFLVDDQETFEVTLPDDGWQHPGRRYEVTFPAPRATSCLGLVLEEAHGAAQGPAVAVTLAEVEAWSRLDGQVNRDELVGRLERSGDESREAAALLLRGGIEARKAVAARYSGLSEPARFLALGAMDQGDCGEGAFFFARLLASKIREEARHARARIERCGKGAAPALLEALQDPSHPARLAAANELALLRPAEAIPALLRADWGAERKGFLGVLSKAAGSERGRPALVAGLQEEALAPARSLDLLRAAGDALRSPEVAAVASSALGRALRSSEDFSARYLALGPAALLAQRGDPAALAMLRAAALDPVVPLRAAAISAAGGVPALRELVLRAESDAEPRVREAVARALQGPLGAPERRVLLGFFGDEWTFVRSTSYDTLGAAPADPAIDQALLARLPGERAPLALSRLIEAVARRRVPGASGSLETLARNEGLPPEVRGRAIQALGQLCHQGAVPWLTKLALAGVGAPQEAAIQLGEAALVALGRLHPPDLAERLGPMLEPSMSYHVRMSAKAALEERERCQ
jgi:HEAT repeat protein